MQAPFMSWQLILNEEDKYITWKKRLDTIYSQVTLLHFPAQSTQQLNAQLYPNNPSGQSDKKE